MKLHNWLPPFGPLVAIGTALAMHVTLGGQKTAPYVAALTLNEESVVSEQGSDPKIAPLSDIAASLASFQDRPLLAEGRRTPQPAAVETINDPEEITPEPVIDPEPVPEPEPFIATAPEPPAVQMLGSMSNENGDAVLIADGADGAQRWVRLGEDIAGWTLIEITPVSIRLAAGDTQATIGLFQ